MSRLFRQEIICPSQQGFEPIFLAGSISLSLRKLELSTRVLSLPHSNSILQEHFLRIVTTREPPSNGSGAATVSSVAIRPLELGTSYRSSRQTTRTRSLGTI